MSAPSSWRTRFGRSLGPKLFGAFVAILALASLTTLLVETNLTRSELAFRAEELASEQAAAYRAQLRAEEAGTTRSLSAFVQQVQIEGDDTRALLDATSVARLAGQFTLAEAFDLATTELQLEAPSRLRITPPPVDAALLTELGSRRAKRRVVPIEDRDGDPAGWGVIYTLPFSDVGGRVALAVGNPLDDGYARDVRGFVGADDVELVVDGQVIASTLDGAASVRSPRPASGDTAVVGVQAATDHDRLVTYLPLGSGDSWGVAAYVGLLLEDPLAPLDARLARFRALMVLLLFVVGAVLAFAIATVMTRPLVRLTRTAGAIAAGDLDASFVAESRDEIGQLAAALERMRRALRAQLLVIGQQADALQEAARRVVSSGDRERQRLAHDLHDGVQGRLVILRMQIGAARARLRQDPTAIDAIADELNQAVDEVLDQLRETGQALYPSILRDRGLGGALRSLAARSRTPVEVTLAPDPLPRVDEAVEAGAYFIVSEAVTNALKHADAASIQVRVTRETDAIRVEVRDAGQGFDPAEVERVGGLQNLRDRVNALGGSLRMVTSPGEGTQVTALLPVGTSADVADPLTALEVEQDGGDPPVEIELL